MVSKSSKKYQEVCATCDGTGVIQKAKPTVLRYTCECGRHVETRAFGLNEMRKETVAKEVTK
jgi:hypothetical protein